MLTLARASSPKMERAYRLAAMKPQKPESAWRGGDGDRGFEEHGAVTSYLTGWREPFEELTEDRGRYKGRFIVIIIA